MLQLAGRSLLGYAFNVGLDSFMDSALVVLGHGTTLNPDSAAAVYQHAAELRAGGCFARVCEAFWKQEPNIVELLPRLTESRVFIVPLFISEGHFSEEVIPRKLGFRTASEPVQSAGDFPRVLRRGQQMLFYCRAVGTHAHVTSVILNRATEVVRMNPFPCGPAPREITLFIAGHGTDKNGNSRKAIEKQVEVVRGMSIYAAVHPLFLEEQPFIAECYGMASTRSMVVVPFFIGEGLHVNEDIPVLLGEAETAVKRRLAAGQPAWKNPTERNGKLVWYAKSAGSDPQMAEVILDRVRELATSGDAEQCST